MVWAMDVSLEVFLGAEVCRCEAGGQVKVGGEVEMLGGRKWRMVFPKRGAKGKRRHRSVRQRRSDGRAITFLKFTL